MKKDVKIIAMDYAEQMAKNGRKGGLKTKELYGVDHFSRAGKKGKGKKKRNSKVITKVHVNTKRKKARA